MSLTAAQIVTLSTQAAKVRGYQSQAGQILNVILQELCQDYDFEVAMGTTTFLFNPALLSTASGSIVYGGPYPMPADYLRGRKGGVWWTLLGVPYTCIPIDLEQFDAQVQQAGLQSYPSLYTTDSSLFDAALQGLSAPFMWFYMPPASANPVTVRYQRQMPDIATPETSSTVPWFPNQAYLRKRLTGELCDLSGDDRAVTMLAEAEDMLRKYIVMKDDKTTRGQRINLDPRVFGKRFSDLPPTKQVWG